MNNNTDLYKRLVVLGSLTLLITFFLMISNHRWKEKKRVAVGFPTKSEFVYPLIPYLAVWDHPDAPKLYSFVENYIHWTVEETLDQYEKQTSSDKSKLDYLKNKLQFAIYASDGPERARIKDKYTDSASEYARLTQCDCGLNFNIDAIESVQSTPRSGVIYVTVLGEFQTSYNGIIRKKADSRMAGYKRLHYMIIQGIPMRDTEDQFVNKYGMYVIRMWEEPISRDVKVDLFKKSFTAGLGYGDLGDFDARANIPNKEGKK
jgi:hypothetical protein